MNDPGDEHQELTRLAELRGNLIQLLTRRDWIKKEIENLSVEDSELVARSSVVLAEISRLGGGGDSRGLTDPRTIPLRRDGQGGWVEASPA